MKNFGYYFLNCWLVLTAVGAALAIVLAVLYSNDMLFAVAVCFMVMAMMALIFPDSWAFKQE